MLNYLDEATARVEQFGLCVRHPNEALQRVYSLQIDARGHVSFRTTPVPPPACVPKSENG
jgi:hypothetical protein